MRRSAINLFILFFLLCCNLSTISSYYEPNVEIEALSPKGIRVTLSHCPGITLFSFHANINSPITRSEPGDINGDVLKKENGKWIFRDFNVHLKRGDTIYYWMYVTSNKLGFSKQGKFRIKGSIVEPDIGTTPTPCETQNNASVICQQLVVNLTQSVFALQDELASVKETNKILRDLIDKDQKLSQRLVLEGLNASVSDLTMIVNAIVRDKLHLSFGVNNVVPMEDGRVEFQVTDIDEKVQILKAAKTKLKNSRYVII